ncbi:hypothetical protein EZV62_023879 [Acer yangbiense]|uniref:Terpene synthase metal-binding domain-containing protein n=1 Tax=Acer yangbiense TaxID=1000413 RepID=A0A5C7H3R9_9ROSI|nr:hypothetical protein EZV62_023879 [Acer yangbiense]
MGESSNATANRGRFSPSDGQGQAKATADQSRNGSTYNNEIPTMEEYFMRVGEETTGYTMLLVVSFIGMGSKVTKEAFDWAISKPKILKAADTVASLSKREDPPSQALLSDEECLRATHEVLRTLIMCVLNLTRMINVIYEEENDYTKVGETMKANSTASLLIVPIPI